MRKPWSLCYLAALVPALLYWQVLDFAYVWDDVSLFLDSAALRGALGFWEAISQPILPGTTYFRPLVLASVYLEFQFGEPSPALSHAINLFIFLVNCVLVGVLANIFLQGAPASRRIGALVVAILFYGLHPAQVESVAWVAGRFDLMVTLFGLLTLIFGLQPGRLNALAMALCFFAATLCKEMAATLPAMLVLLQMARGDSSHGFSRIIKALWLLRVRLMILLLVAGAYLLLRASVMSNLFHQDRLVSDGLTPLSHLSLVGHTFIYYCKTVVVPFFDIGPIHPLNVGMLDLVGLSAGWGGLVGAVLFAVVAVLRGGFKSLLLLAALVALLPVLNIVPLTIGGNVGHERFLAFPLVFVALLVGFSVAQLHRLTLSPAFRGVIAGVIAVWLIGSGVVVSAQLPFWSSGKALWSWAYAKNPDSVFVQFSLVADLIREGRLEQAGKIIEEVEVREGALSRRMQILKASYLQRSGRYRDALALMDKALDGVVEPHKEVLARGAELRDANLSRETFSDGWLFRFVYGVRAEAFLGLRRYNDSLEAARIGQFYQRDYAPLYLLETMSLYGLGRLAEGDEAWAKTQSLYVSRGREEAIPILESFKKQECAFQNRPVKFCERRGWQ